VIDVVGTEKLISDQNNKQELSSQFAIIVPNDN